MRDINLWLKSYPPNRILSCVFILFGYFMMKRHQFCFVTNHIILQRTKRTPHWRGIMSAQGCLIQRSLNCLFKGPIMLTTKPSTKILIPCPLCSTIIGYHIWIVHGVTMALKYFIGWRYLPASHLARDRFEKLKLKENCRHIWADLLPLQGTHCLLTPPLVC